MILITQTVDFTQICTVQTNRNWPHIILPLNKLKLNNVKNKLLAILAI